MEIFDNGKDLSNPADDAVSEKQAKPEDGTSDKLFDAVKEEFCKMAALENQFVLFADSENFDFYKKNYVAPIQKLMAFIKNNVEVQNNAGAYKALVEIIDKAIGFLEAELRRRGENKIVIEESKKTLKARMGFDLSGLIENFRGNTIEDFVDFLGNPPKKDKDKQ